MDLIVGKFILWGFGQVPYFLELFSPLNFSRTDYLAQDEQINPSSKLIVPTPVCTLLSWINIQIAPQHVANLLNHI